MWFQFANGLLLCLIALRYFAFATLPGETLGRLFLALAVPGHFLLLTAAVSMLVLLPAVALPGRWVFPWGVLLFTLLVALVLIDTVVFSLYRFHIDGIVVSLVFSGVASEILPLSASAFVEAGLVLLAVLLGESLLAFAVWRMVGWRARLAGIPIAVAVVLAVIVSHGLHAWADAFLYSPITRQARYLPWFQGLTAYRFMKKQGWLPDQMAAANTVPFSVSALDYPRGPVECTPPAHRSNILIVVIEEWRFDELDPVTTPNLWRFAARGQRFVNHYSSANASRYGVFGLMYGLHGTYWDAFLAEQRGSLLISEAIEQGYRFSIHASASLTHPEFDRTVFAALREQIRARTPGTRGSERDRTITEDFLAFLDEPGDAPFFGFLFYDSPHAMDYPDDFPVPYSPSRPWGNHLELDNDVDPTPLANRHHNAAHYVDSLVGRVLDALERSGRLDDTVLIVTGDHGEEFNELHQNYWGHNSNFARYQTHVAFVARFPERPAGRIEGITSHVDVVPTLMRDVLGCKGPETMYSSGRNLFDTGPRRYVVASGGSQGVGIIEPKRITLMERVGGMRIVDPDMRDLDDARPDGGLMREVMDELSMFYATGARPHG